MNEMDVRLQKSNSEIENKNHALKEFENQINEMRLKMEANKALIDGLISEKNHLELANKENRDQKEMFKEKCDRISKLHEEVFVVMQEYKK